MSKTRETFASTLQSFEYHYDLRETFDDFLTMTICAFSRNPSTGLSFMEDQYLATIAKYKDKATRMRIPKLLALLITEMEDRIDSSEGFDVLGEFFELNISRKSKQQFFTPWHLCQFMAKSTMGEAAKLELDRPVRIIDPACGSGRLMLAASWESTPYNEYYGVDIDHTCVKMTAINFFLGGMFHSEVMCADALLPGHFVTSYRMSFLPFGIFKIDEKEKSPLWNLYNHSMEKEKKEADQSFTPWTDRGTSHNAGSQLKLF